MSQKPGFDMFITSEMSSDPEASDIQSIFKSE